MCFAGLAMFICQLIVVPCFQISLNYFKTETQLAAIPASHLRAARFANTELSLGEQLSSGCALGHRLARQVRGTRLTGSAFSVFAYPETIAAA